MINCYYILRDQVYPILTIPHQLLMSSFAYYCAKDAYGRLLRNVQTSEYLKEGKPSQLG